MDSAQTTLDLPSETVSVGSWFKDNAPSKDRIDAKARAEALVTIVSLIVVGVGGAIASLIFHKDVEWTLLFPLVTLVPMIVTLRHKQTSKADDALKEDPDDELAEIVEMAIYQNGVVTGRARGLMSVLDDTVVFVGRTCTFAIGCQHIRKGAKAWKSGVPDAGGEYQAIPLVHPDRDVWVTARIVRTSATQNLSETKLMSHLRIFVQHHQTPSADPILYPPLARSPDVAIPQKWPNLVLVGAIVISFFAVCGWLSGYWLVFTGLSGAAVIGLFFGKESEGKVNERKLLLELDAQNRISTLSSRAE